MQPFSSLNNSTLQIRLSIVSFAIALFMLNSLQPSTAMALPDGNDAALKPTVFLPLISTGGQRQAPVVFNPPDATTLAGGQYTFDALNIPAGVVVTVEGPLTLHVNGSATIGGTLIGDCVPIFVEAQGDLIISGTVDNRCSDPDAEQVGDLQLYAHSGIQAGTLSTPATILTSGNLDVSNDPATPLWEYDVLPEQRSTVPLAPVCAATADSLWETTLPNLPATIRFTGEGADPDGGPIDMKWNFGDQSPAAVGPQVAHTYVAVGAYTVTLTVTDDDSQSCTAILALNIDDGENSFAQPVVEMQPVDLVIPVGEELAFTSDLADAQGGDLTYAWTFGDNISSNVLTATHRYAEAGRYAISLHVTDGEGNRREATASVYVYTPLTDLSTATIEHRFCPPNPLPPNVLLVNPATINNLPPAAPGRDGSSQTYRGRGTVIIAPGANIRGQDGGAGLARTGVGLVRGQNGGNGGSLNILVNGRLVLCAGVTLAAGDGGRGSNATATVPPVQTAHAYAGRGGDAGHRLRLQATNSIHIEGPVMVDPGSGGDGGDATATGDDGADRCDSAQAGAHALAVGGHGGDASKFFWGRGRVHGIRNITLINGLGGVGGDGNAIAGNGGKAICPTNAIGGLGGHARARGGYGGHAPLTSAAASMVIRSGAFTAGDGGLAFAMAGHGGEANATSPAVCAATTAKGGDGNAAQTVGGQGGKGRINGQGGEGHATGGIGGSATAIGGDCTLCNKGGDATATGGKGGKANARAGWPHPVLDGTTAIGGNGGPANARGGQGGDCPTCPAGSGGNGGLAAATGGTGGDAVSTGIQTGGTGGDVDALGGQGGKGADCCKLPKPGGNGGIGGNATANAGAGGNPGGQAGNNAEKAGDGGNGGNGKDPGAGGPGGVGQGFPFTIPDGIKGLDGAQCPVPIITDVTVTISVSQTTPSHPVTLTTQMEGENLPQIDSFFDIFFTISSRDLISDRVPTISEGSGGYRAIHQFTAAGDYLIDTLVIRKADSEILPMIRDPQPLRVTPIPTELVALNLTSYSPGILPGMADTLLLVGRDPFGNPISNLPPGAFECFAYFETIFAIILGPPSPLPSDFFDLSGVGLGLLPTDQYLGIPRYELAYGEGGATCRYPPSGATTTLPIAFAPWRLPMLDAQGRPGTGFLPDSFFDLLFEVRVPVGAQVSGSGGLIEWPSHLPISFDHCRPNIEGLNFRCQLVVGTDGISRLDIRYQGGEPPHASNSIPLIIRFNTQGGDSEIPLDGEIHLTEIEPGIFLGDSAIPGPEWRLHPFTIKPIKRLKLHIYHVEGAATTAEIDADVAQAQKALTLNALQGTCTSYLELDVISTTVPITDWQTIDPHGDGFDRLDTNNDGDFDDEADHNDPLRARDLGYFDPVSDTINIYYVPGIGRGALGETYAPSGQAAVDNTRDDDGWTLFHELVRVLDLRKDGDFDLHNSPDVPNDVQGAQDPNNAMNYDAMGPYLTKAQCAELD